MFLWLLSIVFVFISAPFIRNTKSMESMAVSQDKKDARLPAGICSNFFRAFCMFPEKQSNQHIPQLVLRNHFDPEVLCFLELATGHLAGQQISRFFADAAGCAPAH